MMETQAHVALKRRREARYAPERFRLHEES